MPVKNIITKIKPSSLPESKVKVSGMMVLNEV
jgi:hypothetical protein